MTPPFALLASTFSAYPSLFPTPLTSPITKLIFSFYLNRIFNLLFLSPFTALSQFFPLASLPPCGMSFHLPHIFFITAFPLCILHTFFFIIFFHLFLCLFIYLDAPVSGWDCSEYLKAHLALALRPTCPSCSMWRSQTLEPQFWAPLMSSACWDTTAMYPSWSKVGSYESCSFYFTFDIAHILNFSLPFSLLFPSSRSGFQSPPGCSGCQQPLLSWPLQQLHQDPVWVALLSHTCLLWADPHVLLHREANYGR